MVGWSVSIVAKNVRAWRIFGTKQGNNLVRVPPAKIHPTSFDHLVGAGEQRRRHDEPKRLGGLEVDRQFEFGGLITRNTAWICAAQNRIDIAGSPLVEFDEI